MTSMTPLQGTEIKHKATANSPRGKFWELIRVVLIALAAVILVRVFFLEVYRIPSASMLPTLEVGDFIVVKKYSYGYSRYSLPFGHLLDIEGRIFGSGPERGEMAIFRKPTDTKIAFVKRIIGLPGDAVQVIDGHLYINDIMIDRQARDSYTRPEWAGSVAHYWEDGPQIKGHAIIEVQGDAAPYTDNTQRYVVPQGHYFAMGDNRDSSLDSRFLREIGFVPYDNLVGKPFVVLFSFDAGASGGFWLRFGRFFKSLI